MLKYLVNKAKLPSNRLTNVVCKAKSNYYGVLSQFTFHQMDFKPTNNLQQCVDKYRKNGHHFAKIDPLDLNNP